MKVRNIFEKTTIAALETVHVYAWPDENGQITRDSEADVYFYRPDTPKPEGGILLCNGHSFYHRWRRILEQDYPETYEDEFLNLFAPSSAFGALDMSAAASVAIDEFIEKANSRLNDPEL